MLDKLSISPLGQEEPSVCQLSHGLVVPNRAVTSLSHAVCKIAPGQQTQISVLGQTFFFGLGESPRGVGKIGESLP